ncbi:MAG: ethanolamine ammonia-lyase subunit EutC [Solirubrobacteraceae bacterium]|nr:ethanolamine ammonia-lyase subunit EutC [Solirubrobacteraceae bacterium]
MTGEALTTQDDVRALLTRRAREVTPARIFTGGPEGGYTTTDLLALRADHAAARDAVLAPLDLADPALADIAARHAVFAVDSQAGSIEEHLLRPDLGRRLSDAGRAAITAACTPATDVQIVIGDGLSAAAVHAQVPTLLPLLVAECRQRGWTVGRPFAVRHCRVGVMNDVGDALDPAVVVLLVGERPGLATAESLSAYLAYRPRPGDTDAKRDLISNIHARGLTTEEAVRRIGDLIAEQRALRGSGVAARSA